MASNQKVNIKEAQKINQKVISKTDSGQKKATNTKQSAENSEEKKMSDSAISAKGSRNENTNNLKTGISYENSLKVADELNQVLSDEVVLYVKTSNFHWNIEGRDFHALHLFLEEQYKQLQVIIDSVAERVRKVGQFAKGSMREFLDATSIGEHSGGASVSEDMLSELASDHDALIRKTRALIQDFNEKYYDAGSADFITGVMKEHEKMAWMLRASAPQLFENSRSKCRKVQFDT